MADPTGLDFFTYPLRRLWWWLHTPESSCHIVYCPRPRLGVSRYCRTHTDEVLERHNDGDA
jgi:hypothetical protein